MNCQYKNILIEILLELDRVCKENNLRYFLAGGTLLGSIRHKGFIPWDDDIDVVMPRPDYEKLIELAHLVFHQKFKLTTNDIDDNYYHRYAKLYHQETTLVECKYPFYIGGLFVDIFPLDGMPENEIERKKHYANYRYALKKLVKLYIEPRNILSQKNIVEIISSIIHQIKFTIYHIILSKKECIKSCERIAKKYPYENSNYVVNFGGAWGEREIFLKEIFENEILSEFEGHLYKIPQGYDMLLKNLYGNYMQLPPIDKQVTHHKHYILDLNKRLSLDEIKDIIKRK